MCDACLQLGTSWLPALHGGRKRPTVKAVLGLRTKKSAPEKKRPKL
jgi:hypothetical protein